MLRFGLGRAVSIFLALFLLLSVSKTADAQEVGQIVVPQENTTLRIGSRDVLQVTPEDQLTVLGASSDPPGWLWVQTEKTGWVAQEKVRPIPAARDAPGLQVRASAAEAQYLAGWMAGANASLIHQQVQLTAEILAADLRQSQRVAGLAGQLARQAESSIERLNELSGLVPSRSGVLRLLELFRSLRGEAVALRNWAQEGTSSSSQLFDDAFRQTSQLFEGERVPESAPPAPPSDSAP